VLTASDLAPLPDLIRARAAERSDHPALVEGYETLTSRGLVTLIDRIAFALQRDGVRAGDAVAISAKTSINYAAAFLPDSLPASSSISPTSFA
jgi:long-chain acyl-CoA synthetase